MYLTSFNTPPIRVISILYTFAVHYNNKDNKYELMKKQTYISPCINMYKVVTPAILAGSGEQDNVGQPRNFSVTESTTNGDEEDVWE